MAFVESMVEDSIALGGQVHWYTSMVGKKGTMKALRMLLYRRGVRVLRTTEFVQARVAEAQSVPVNGCACRPQAAL